MPNCHEMREGEIYVCEECGIEVKVVKECQEVGAPAAGCEHGDPGDDHCAFRCCGADLKKKA